MPRSSALTSIAPVISTTNVGEWLEHYRALGFAVDAFDEGYGFACRGSVELHVSFDPQHDPAKTAGCADVAVDALAAEWHSAPGGRNVPPVDTDYGTREGAHIDVGTAI